MIESNDIEYIVLAICIIYTAGMLYFGHRQRKAENMQRYLDRLAATGPIITWHKPGVDVKGWDVSSVVSVDAADMTKMFANCKGNEDLKND